ncbi:MAG TPA: hypoxanthine phosphoribosyltransferase [Nitriliruptoraceae bacterium]|nr:hypoxanthine phosphoribosyltransferase [Nitriliruptoraceae bacterium]
MPDASTEVPTAIPGGREAVKKADLARVPAAFADHFEDVLVTSHEIDARLDEIARAIEEDHADTDNLLLVGVLRGAYVLMADLARRLRIPTSVDFMAVSSYGAATTSSGVVRILKDLDTRIEDRHVLIVEDIIDSGLTLDYLINNLRSRGPASIDIMTLLTKPSRRRVDIPVRYTGFEVPDVFVVGYGLDFDEQYRNLQFIGTLKPEVYS